MAVNKSVLADSVEALKAYYEKLNRTFYGYFSFRQLSDFQPATPRNTVLVAKREDKQMIEQLFVEVKSVLASAMEAYLSYKNGWFSDQEFASKAKRVIDEVSAEYEKTKHFFDTYKFVEE